MSVNSFNYKEKYPKKMIAKWATDLHLNFRIDREIKNKFLKSLNSCKTPVFITGDIGDGRSLENNLKEIAQTIDNTVYFVTGNHDYYHSSFKRTKEIIDYCIMENPNLVYLPDSNVVRLNCDTCIIGTEDWYDAKTCENMDLLSLRMNDFNLIEDFRYKCKKEVIDIFQKRALNGLKQLKKLTQEASKNFKNMIIILHPAPFKEMVQKDEELIPFYVWKDAGDYLKEFVLKNSEMNILCLNGHTHSRMTFNFNNLNCYSLEACYSLPKLETVINDDLTVKYGS